MSFKTFALLAAALAAGGNAFAQATINHNKALAGNVSPGDAPGYPVTLSKPGHYVLKGHLTVPDGTTGVLIQTDGVTLDLNGFTISGNRTCAFDLATYVTACPAGGGLRGVDSSSHMLTMRNGTVRGFELGVWAAGGLVENVVARHNTVGIFTTDARPMRLTGVMAELNSQAGLRFDSMAMVDNAVVSFNTIGIDNQGGSTAAVRDSAVYVNATGIVGGVARSTRVMGNKTDLIGTGTY